MASGGASNPLARTFAANATVLMEVTESCIAVLEKRSSDHQSAAAAATSAPPIRRVLVIVRKPKERKRKRDK